VVEGDAPARRYDAGDNEGEVDPEGIGEHAGSVRSQERKAGLARLFSHGALDFGVYELTSEMLLTVIVSPSSEPSTVT
jgi:hypothetical protein